MYLGEQVYYHAAGVDLKTPPQVAWVTRENADGSVNIAGFDPFGAPFLVHNVEIRNEPGESHLHWVVSRFLPRIHLPRVDVEDALHGFGMGGQMVQEQEHQPQHDETPPPADPAPQTPAETPDEPKAA